MQTMSVGDVFHGNKNSIGKDGLIYNVYSGNQTIGTLKKAEKELQRLSSQLRAKRLPVLVLTEIRELGSINISARMYAVEFIKHIDFDKVAIFGNSYLAERIVNAIIMASGHGFNMKYFHTEKEAKEWLLH